MREREKEREGGGMLENDGDMQSPTDAPHVSPSFAPSFFRAQCGRAGLLGGRGGGRSGRQSVMSCQQCSVMAA